MQVASWILVLFVAADLLLSILHFWTISESALLADGSASVQNVYCMSWKNGFAIFLNIKYYSPPISLLYIPVAVVAQC